MAVRQQAARLRIMQTKKRKKFFYLKKDSEVPWGAGVTKTTAIINMRW